MKRLISEAMSWQSVHGRVAMTEMPTRHHDVAISIFLMTMMISMEAASTTNVCKCKAVKQ